MHSIYPAVISQLHHEWLIIGLCQRFQVNLVLELNAHLEEGLKQLLKRVRVRDLQTRLRKFIVSFNKKSVKIVPHILLAIAV